ncbi:hypothetical protein J4232_00795 [Candidatus Woesearchaeota archaeon]|nr:hypothetical protein [Candidatus Woesearchaeota archaeon]
MLHNKYFEIIREFLGDYNKSIYGKIKNILSKLRQTEIEEIRKKIKML